MADIQTLRDILLRQQVHGELSTKGSNLTNIEVDDNFIAVYEALRDIFLNHVELPVFDSGKTYTDGSFTIESGLIYISLQDGNINNTPGISGSELFWQLATFAQIISINPDTLSEGLNLSDTSIYNVATRTLSVPSNKKYARLFYLTADLYSASDTYSIGDIVRSNGASGGQSRLSYKSKTNGNIGNLLSNGTHWAFADALGTNSGNIEIASTGVTNTISNSHISKFRSEDMYVRFVATAYNSSPPPLEGDILLDLNSDVTISYMGFLSLLNEGGVSVKQAVSLFS